MNANLEHLEKVHGSAAKAEAAFREIADKGGFGVVGKEPGQIHPAYAGGLDVAGVLADGNKDVSSAAKDRIAELMGVSRGKATEIVDKGGTKSSAEKMKPQEN